jgi:hypothetical protein
VCGGQCKTHLALWADGWLRRELQRLLQDVFKGGIPLGPLERGEAVQ